jgi:hypothetical protein
MYKQAREICMQNIGSKRTESEWQDALDRQNHTALAVSSAPGWGRKRGDAISGWRRTLKRVAEKCEAMC